MRLSLRMRCLGRILLFTRKDTLWDAESQLHYFLQAPGIAQFIA